MFLIIERGYIMKLIAMILTAIIAFFSWVISPFVPERTEFVVDRKYVGFSSADKLMDNFLLLTEGEDADGIYTIFSPKAKNESENLHEKIPELIQFFNESMISWEPDGGYGESSSVGGTSVFQDYPDYLLYTDDITYSCRMNITNIDTGNADNEGFYSILIYPDELYQYCSGFGKDKGGIYIFYPADEEYQSDIMEKIVSLAKAENSGGVYDLFSQTAKDSSENLKEKIPDLMEFFKEKVTSWEFQTYIKEKGTLWEESVIKRELLFLIYTQEETYHCNIRDIIEDKENGKNLGLYSIAIYPQEMYFQYSTLGYYESGIFRKSLTIKPSDNDVDGGGIVTLTTSKEATVTCDRPYVTLTQKDYYTWEAYLLNGTYAADFTATSKDESATCRVTVDESEESDVEKLPVSGKLQFNLNGGELSNADVMITNYTHKAVGSTVDLTEYVPVKKGYHFTGWYADKKLTKPIMEIVMEKKSIVYAGWEKEK